MPSFNCDGCGDVIKKPKLDSHSMRCRSSVTCLDCSTTFTNPASWKSHTSCISEAQKYQKSLYKPPKSNNKSNGHHQSNIKNHAAPSLTTLTPSSTNSPSDTTPANHEHDKPTVPARQFDDGLAKNLNQHDQKLKPKKKDKKQNRQNLVNEKIESTNITNLNQQSVKQDSESKTEIEDSKPAEVQQTSSTKKKRKKNESKVQALDEKNQEKEEDTSRPTEKVSEKTEDSTLVEEQQISLNKKMRKNDESKVDVLEKTEKENEEAYLKPTGKSLENPENPKQVEEHQVPPSKKKRKKDESKVEGLEKINKGNEEDDSTAKNSENLEKLKEDDHASSCKKKRKKNESKVEASQKIDKENQKEEDSLKQTEKSSEKKKSKREKKRAKEISEIQMNTNEHDDTNQFEEPIGQMVIDKNMILKHSKELILASTGRPINIKELITSNLNLILKNKKQKVGMKEDQIKSEIQQIFFDNLQFVLQRSNDQLGQNLIGLSWNHGPF